MAKKKNAQDSTRRNVRASNKRDAKLLARLRKLEASVGLLAATVATLASLMSKR